MSGTNNREAKMAVDLFGAPIDTVSPNDRLRITKALRGEHPCPSADPDGFFYTDPYTGERMDP